MPTVLQAAARAFAVVPAVGDPTEGRTGAAVLEVVGDLKSTAVLFEDGPRRLLWVTWPAETEIEEMRLAIEATAAERLGLSAAEVVIVSSHNHCAPMFVENGTSAWRRPAGAPALGRLNPLGRAFIAELARALEGLRQELVPVAVEWGRAREERITFNRKGRRADGSAYLIREEDRLLLGENYLGEIDPDATVVVLRGPSGRPVAALAHFTGHPVSAYNPERPIAFGEWPQVACEKLAAHLGAPVAFLQGCAGDIGSKYMLTGTVAQSRELGGYLGDAFIRALDSLRPSTRRDFRHRRVPVAIPLADLPAEASIRKDLAEIDAFIRRGHAGDEDTLACVGMNFPRAVSPLYRARLVEMVRPWHVWALGVHQAGRVGQGPKFLPVEIEVARFGDVGFVGMPFETFVRTGLKIKREAPLPCVLACGYTRVEGGYIPDAEGCADREYMSGFYRYTPDWPPFRPPAGDAMAIAGVAVLRELSA